jgi:hypothetical protein
MSFDQGHLLLQVRVGGRPVAALLDSGAGITVVEARSRAASAFVPTLHGSAAGVTQNMRVGFGELPQVDVGELRIEALPTASIPIPALETFGQDVPEIILGYTFFALGSVRVDYRKREVVFARPPAMLAAPDARRVPFQVLGTDLVASAAIEDRSAAMILDTGNGNGFDLFTRWAGPNGIPGSRKTARVRGLFGAGDQETDEVFFRLTKATLGPIVVEGSLSHTLNQPGNDGFAGIVGNEVFSRCDAVTFDHGQRTLFVEGDCRTAGHDGRYGWRLARKDDSVAPSTPWIIQSVMPGSAADAAGLRAGDRILDVDGQPAVLDGTSLRKAERRPLGTKLAVTVRRDGKTERMTLVLTAPLR